jgi:hypothetical protein
MHAAMQISGLGIGKGEFLDLVLLGLRLEPSRE